MVPVHRVDQLRRNPYAVPGLLQAAFNHVANAEILRDLFDDEVASSIEVPYCLGDLGELRALLDRSGARDAEIATYVGQARFESIDAWVHTDVKGWTLADVLDDAGYERLKVAARERLAEFAAPDGSVVFDAPAHVIKIEC